MIKIYKIISFIAVIIVAFLIVGCRSTATGKAHNHGHAWVARIHKSNHRVGLCVSVDCGPYAAALRWNISWPAHTTTGYYVFLNSTQEADVPRSPWVVDGADCGTTSTLGVEAHDGGGNHSSMYTASYTTPSCASWPSTYTDGPLGANEVLPNSGGALLALWSGVAGNTAAQQRTFMQQRITDMGRTPDIIGFACDASCSPGSAMLDTSSSNLSENWIHSLGAVPFVSWSPGSDTDFTGITAGNYNTEIDAAASRFKTFGHRIMLRMFEEFNLNAWNSTNFVAAWQYIVNRFEADGATNVGFVWCPSEHANTTERAEVLASYPGNSYVDWVSSDSYNNNDGSDSQPCVSGWAEFAQLFNYNANNSNCGTNAASMEQQYGPTKPYFVSETGSKYDGSSSSHKANWFTNITTSAIPAMPYLIGVQFFDQDVNTEEPGNNWRVDSNCQGSGTNCSGGTTDTTTYNGFLSMASAAAFNVGVAGGDS